MLRFLLVSSPEKGHVNPLMGVAHHLLRLGHHVSWLGLPRPAERLRELGIEPLGIPEEVRGERSTETRPLTEVVRDPRALSQWIESLLLGSVEGWLPQVRRVMEDSRPDAIALDPMQYVAVLAAEQLGIPFAGVSSSLNPVTPPEWECDLTRTVARLAPARAALFAKHGTVPSFRVCDALSPHVNIVFSTAAYVGSAHVPGRTHLVGPSAPLGVRGDEVAFPWERLDPSRSLVYVSFGSQIAHQPRAFANVATAADGLGAQVVINAGSEQVAREVERLPGRVVGVPYAPQLSLLNRAAVMVSHGGANSVMEAHRAGVPLLLSPVCNDQPLQGRFLERSGAGRVLDLEGASIEATREALAALLPPGSMHRAALAPITASYRERDGAFEAARRLVELTR